mgnify:CR=1 FL=1
MWILDPPFHCQSKLTVKRRVNPDEYGEIIVENFAISCESG